MPMERSHIWLGQFQSEKALEAYFEESYHDSDLEQEAPMNRFAADQGVDFYDHDWLEYSFSNTGNLSTLITEHSYADDYITHVAEFAKANGLTNINTFIMVDYAEVPEPKSCIKLDYTLWFVGTFECTI